MSGRAITAFLSSVLGNSSVCPRPEHLAWTSASQLVVSPRSLSLIPDQNPPSVSVLKIKIVCTFTFDGVGCCIQLFFLTINYLLKKMCSSC